MVQTRPRLSRRTLVFGLPLVAVPGPALAAPPKRMIAYKTPWCGCCGGWIAHMRQAGWIVEVVEREDLAVQPHGFLGRDAKGVDEPDHLAPAVLDRFPRFLAEQVGQFLRAFLVALQRANKVRLARAELKRQISTREITVGDVVLSTPWEAASMTVADLLMSQKRWGRTRCKKFLSAIPLSETKTVGSLTERQRHAVAQALGEEPGQRDAGLGATVRLAA